VLGLAEQEQAGLVFAHDPDADRLAVAVRTRAGTLRVLNGDEVGALLGDFALSLHTGKRTPLVVSTVVSSGLLAEIARARGARYERTLTGFKWIAARARALEASEQLEFVFGYEEAIGYAFGALGDDKDGVAALRVLVELARRLHARGLTLADALSELSRQHGLFVTRQITLRADSERMTRLMSHARALPPATLLGEGATVRDYLTEPERANLLVFAAPDGTRLCVRPSGTEPKVKFYLESRTIIAHDEREDDAALRARARLDALAASIDLEFA
jgi:phosphomannomutase